MDFKQASEMRYNIQPEVEFSEPMVYDKNRSEEQALIAKGFYNGLNYYVKNVGYSHPTAYIEIPQGHKAFCAEKLQDLPCHYGVTYTEMHLRLVDDNGERGHVFVGWDYAHYGDYMPYYKDGEWLEQHSHRWKTEEVVAECKEAIDWINNI